MAVSISTNVAALCTQRRLNSARDAMLTSLQRLGSGMRINSAKDDAVGLSVTSRMSAQIGGMGIAIRNTNDTISLLQTAESAMDAVGTDLQRMRELAVRAANGANTASDRLSIDSEMQQLSAEIQRLAVATSFNGIKLLDGSFSVQSFQIGANQNDAITINAIHSMQTPELGSTGSTFEAKTTGTTVNGLASGDLRLNGIAIDASQAGASPGQGASSAYAVAAAINLLATDSGVTASANATELSVGTPSALGGIAGNTFSINGSLVGAVAGGATADEQTANLAAAIMGVSAQTGVTAAVAASTGVLTLKAADGRNIDIGLADVAANPAAAAANKSSFLALTGLAADAVGTQASLPVAAKNNISFSGPVVLADVGKTVVINGVAFTIANSAAASAVVDANHVTLNIDIAGGNNSASAAATGLYNAIASAQANPLTAAALGTLLAADDGAGTVTLTDAVAGASATSLATNASTGHVANSVAGTPAGAATIATTRGTVTLTSSRQDGISIGGGIPANAGFNADQIPANQVSTVIGIDTLNLLTAANAQNAIVSLDSAIDMVVASRVSLGTYQNRFAVELAKLEDSRDTTTTSRSRILDADFAVESASQVRNQILLAAGTAMLSQANALPNIVLSLLSQR